MTPGPGARRRPHWAAFVIAGGLALLAFVLLRDAASLPQEGGYAGVGPADVPRLIAYGLLILAAATVVAGWRDTLPRAPAQKFGPVLWILAGLGLQLLTLQVAGFTIACGLLFGFTARAFDAKPLWVTVLIGFGVAFVIYVIFALLLKLSLPAGPPEELLKGLLRRVSGAAQAAGSGGAVLRGEM